MNGNSLTFLGIFLIYFAISLDWTQKIYAYNRFMLVLALAIALPTAMYFMSPKEFRFQFVHCSLLIFYYLITLWTVKRTYKKLNHFFIRKKLVLPEFSDKDFTHVHWDSDIPAAGDWWDEKLASKPSWLDKFLSWLILIVPVLILTGVVGIIKALSPEIDVH